MKYTLLLLPLTCTAFRQQQTENTILIHTTKQTDLKCPVLGKYGRQTLISCDIHQLDLTQSLKEKEEVTYFNTLHLPAATHVVLEHQRHEQDEQNAEKVWLQRVKRFVKGPTFPSDEKVKGDVARIFATIPQQNIDTIAELLPPNTQILIVPTVPFAPAEEVPEDHIVAELLSAKELPNQKAIKKVLELASRDSIRTTVRVLTGEDGDMHTRHSQSGELIQQATDYLMSRFQDYGCKTEMMYYRTGYAPNIICELAGTTEPEKVVILSAHYDDRNAWIYGPKGRAPGANDDGSGTSMVIEVAKMLYEAKVTTAYTIRLILFSGEEQGLYGSKAYAEQVVANQTNVLTMIQGDMLGYHKPGEPYQVGFPGRYATNGFTKLLVRIFELYVSELKTGITYACCSDHQSFYEKGIVSSQIFERAGDIADPMYHNKYDLSDRVGYDIDQIVFLAKGAIASVLTIATIA